MYALSPLPRPLGALAVAAVAAVGLLLPSAPAQPADKAAEKAPDKAAVERTRETVRLLDDVHKGYVVTITDTYVKAREKAPAAAVAKKVFKHLTDKGWGTGRLIDA